MLLTRRFAIILLLWPSAFALGQARVQPVQIADAALATLHIDGYPDFLAADGEDVWVTNSGKVQKLSVRKSTPEMTIEIPDPCGAPVVAGGSLFVASCKTREVYQIDTKTGKIIASIPTGIADPAGEISLAFGAGSLWILSDSLGILSRIDPKTKSVVARIPVKSHSYCAAFGFGSVWVSNSQDKGSVQRIDPAVNAVIATIPVGPRPHFLAVGENGVWTLNQKYGSVSRVDPKTNLLVKTIPTGVPGTGGDIATGAGYVWVRASEGTFLQAITASSNLISEEYAPLCGSGAVRVAGNLVWISAHDIHTVWVVKKETR